MEAGESGFAIGGSRAALPGLTPDLALDAQTLSAHTRANDGDHYIRWITTVDLLARF